MDGYEVQTLLKERKKDSLIWWNHVIENRDEKDLCIISFPKKLKKTIKKYLDINNITYTEIDKKNKKTASCLISVDDQPFVNNLVYYHTNKKNIWKKR